MKYLKDLGKHRCLYPQCGQRFIQPGDLFEHVKIKHPEVLNEDMTPKRYIFNTKYKKDKGSCVICKQETKWNEELGRYQRFDKPACEEQYIKIFRQRMMKVYNKEHLLNDPDIQRRMLESRSIAVDYTFQRDKSVVIKCIGSYEYDFIKFLDEATSLPPDEISPCNIIFDYQYEGTSHKYIPDFYIESLNLIIEIKDFTLKPNNYLIL